MSSESIANVVAGNQHKTSNTNTKTIYLIRHAESLENVAYKGARRVQAAYASRKFPQPSDVRDAFTLLFKMFRPSVTNAALSEFGRQQVSQLYNNLLRDDFWQSIQQQSDSTPGVVLVAHSPLQRAKQTAYGALWGPAHMDDDDDDDSHQTPLPSRNNYQHVTMTELPLLKEVNPAEIIQDALAAPFGAKQKTVDVRIRQLEEWIQSRPPEETIVLVGHSVYFKRMLNLPNTFDNCDVWQATFQLNNGAEKDSHNKQGDSGLPRSWMSLKRMYGLEPEKIQVVDEE